MDISNIKEDSRPYLTKVLKSKLQFKGITMGELAKAMGISLNTLSLKINCQVEFKVGEAKKVCKILDIEDPVSVFFN